ncbi:transcription factor grauzone-like [Anopheles arabiensis]|uniref:transcription factor grauzone-like n=1 Tax=Anopheles arabiensis TaxID=7173 RepID=UPI001AACDC07|nr:transcription factor grauzone-like [Anopheles arabiensis]
MKNEPQTCRLCLRSSFRGRKIAISNGDFQQKLKAVFSFDIAPAENLPADACRGCRETVEQFYEYSEKVRANQDSLQASITAAGADPDGKVKKESPAKVASEANVHTDPADSIVQVEKYHIELLKVEPCLPAAKQTSDQHDEPVVEYLSESLVKAESNDSLNYDDDNGDVLEDTEPVREEPTTDEDKGKQNNTPQRRKRENRPREEDEELLRKHFHLGCEKCPFKAETVAALFHHYRLDHQTPGYVECCNRKFFRRARLLEHLGAHLGSIVCDVCGKVFRNVCSLNLHKLDHEQPKHARQYKCERCNYSFHKLYHLKQHQKRHERLRCTVCDKVLAGEQGLKTHMQKVHGTDNTQICPTCGKEFRCLLAMKRHIRAHLGIVTVERVQCDQCAKWFDSKLNLRNHIKGVHDGAGPIQCDECQHVSPNRRALTNHKLRTHGRKQTFECEHCGKKLNTKLTLKEHMATHTNIPLYSCEFCGITFNSNANKYVHRKSKHPQEWEAMMQQKLMQRMGPAAILSESFRYAKMSERCRLCLGSLSSTGPKLSIRDAEFQEELKTVFHFDIIHDTALPEHVCNECRSTVSYCHSYCLQVQANQLQLLGEANENVLKPVENVMVELLVEEDDCTKTEKHLQKEELAVNQEATMCLEDREGLSVDEDCVRGKNDKQRRRACKSIKNKPDLQKETENQDTSSKELSQAKQLENDKIITQFFTLECEICAATAESFVQLLDHYRTAHKTKGYVRCCGKQFFRRYILVDHIAAHRGTIRCEICHKTYKTKRYLALHFAKSHSGETDRPFKCGKCHVSYPKQYLLRAHELMHVQQQCHICEKVLSNTQSLKVHIAQMHGGDGHHICDTCGKVFRTKPAMERHINEHMGVDVVERLQCDHCQKWFSGKYNLRKHVRFMHLEGGQVFRCELCPHESPNSRALANHKLRVHVEERFECEYCGKRFKRRPNLREHIASHTNMPLYSCEICQNRTFNSKANYFTHRKHKHPQEWEAQKRLRTEREMSKN